MAKVCGGRYARRIGVKSILISGAFIIQKAIKVNTENGSFNQAQFGSR